MPYRGTSLIRNTHPPRITIGPWAWGYCREIETRSKTDELVQPGGLVVQTENGDSRDKNVL